MDSNQKPVGRALTDLLDLENIFLQHPLLTASEFGRKCERRGLSFFMAKRQLEALHQAGVLLPIYRVIRDMRNLRRSAREGDLPLSVVGASVTVRGLDWREEHRQKRVRDPRSEPFVSWHRYERTIDNHRIHTSEFVYSPYHLLLLPDIRSFMPLMRKRRVSPLDYRFRLHLEEHALKRADTARRENDQLVVLLSALDRIYRPHITGVVTLPGVGTEGEEAWQSFEETFDPAALLTWLGWSAERVHNKAEHLIDTAGFLDPLDDWLPLVRLCRPEKWERLRGDALIAIDHRIAAEILLRFYDDLVDAGVAPALPQIPRFAPHPLQERLKRDRNALDAVLMDFGLSPQPSLILFLEGETEMEIVPRVRDRLALRWPGSFIEIHNAYGVTANIGRIARYMVPLAFGEAHGDFVELTRPATRILAVFDRENALSDDEKIQTEKQAWVTEFLKSVPESYRTPAIQEAIHNQIEVITWNEGSFEFAHFSDTELRTAILNACRRLGVADGDIPAWQIEDARNRQRNIEKVFPGKAKRRLTKTELAKDLWPILEDKIRVALETKTLDSIPILRVLRLALEQATTVHRSNVGIQVRRLSDSAAT